MKSLNDKLTFSSGHQMKNRFMLAPLTNTQSYEDGVLSDDEYHWLTKRAKGGFGITMSCASHVQDIGKGFPGQLGIFDNLRNPICDLSYFFFFKTSPSNRRSSNSYSRSRKW